MGTALRITVVALACCAQALLAQAQTPSKDNPLSRGTMISGVTGMALASSQSGPLFGGSVGWELSPRLAVDGSGTWADYGADSDAFAAAIKLRTNLAWWGSAIPFVEAGVGMYRASFGPNPEDVPGFYERRMVEGDSVGSRAFTDPSIVFGGGLNVAISRTLRLRPDIEFAVVMRDSRTHVVSGVRLHLVYVFEDHPVTPSRKR